MRPLVATTDGLVWEERPLNWFFVVLGALSSEIAIAQQMTGEERLLGAEVARSGITFQVPSSGCTKKANFGLETWSFHPLTVRLVRLRPDYCQAVAPQGTRITYSFPEIGLVNAPASLKDVVIVNPRPLP